MPKLTNRLPKYRLHKLSGQAIVTLNGFDHYLGDHGTEASKQAYQRMVTEWLASNKLGATKPAAGSDSTVDEIFVCYWGTRENLQREGPAADRCAACPSFCTHSTG